MTYQHVKLPAGGAKISIKDGKLNVPDNPILGFVEGDGIGVDITPASLRIWDAAVAKAYGGKRKIHWCEIYLGEKAQKLYDGNFFPDETLEAIKDLVVSIKGPLTTPVGGGFRSLNVTLRQDLDLYACVRPVKHYAGVPSPLKKPELKSTSSSSVRTPRTCTPASSTRQARTRTRSWPSSCARNWVRSSSRTPAWV